VKLLGAIVLLVLGVTLGACLSQRSLVPAVGGTPDASTPCMGTATPVWHHVVWILMENKPYSSIIGSNDAPYVNSLASKCGLATNYSAITHPSLPNYIAMTSGSTQGITDDAEPPSHPLTAPSLFSQLGRGWRSLEETMPENCYLTNSDSYAVRHNPAAYFTNIRKACTHRDVPLGSTPDISARFTFVTPNACNDMHDCSVAVGDRWLSSFIPRILSSPTYAAGDTALVLTWDEDDHSAGNHVVTVIVAPSVPAGTKSATTFTHYSLLRTTEEMLGQPLLGNASSAASMRSAFHL
jgi:phosphatidylinositol-3-phosphatase